MSWLITPSYDGFTDDADATAYLAAVQAADGQVLEPAVRLAVNTFVKGCKADGIWDAIKASCILAGARTLTGALVPLVGTAPTSFNFVSGDYNRKTGLVGDASTKYLNSNRAGNADPQDSNHNAIYASTAATSNVVLNFPAYFGNGGSADTGANIVGRLNSNGNLYTANRTGTLDSTSAGAAQGFIAINRSVSAQYQRRTSASTVSLTFVSETPAGRNMAIFASSRVAGISNYSNARLAFYSIGESLDLALLDARVTDLINAFAAAIP